MRRERKSLRIGVHHANAVVWGPVYRTRLTRGRHRLGTPRRRRRRRRAASEARGVAREPRERRAARHRGGRAGGRASGGRERGRARGGLSDDRGARGGVGDDVETRHLGRARTTEFFLDQVYEKYVAPSSSSRGLPLQRRRHGVAVQERQEHPQPPDLPLAQVQLLEQRERERRLRRVGDDGGHQLLRGETEGRRRMDSRRSAAGCDASEGGDARLERRLEEKVIAKSLRNARHRANRRRMGRGRVRRLVRRDYLRLRRRRALLFVVVLLRRRGHRVERVRQLPRRCREPGQGREAPRPVRHFLRALCE